MFAAPTLSGPQCEAGEGAPAIFAGPINLSRLNALLMRTSLEPLDLRTSLGLPQRIPL